MDLHNKNGLPSARRKKKQVLQRRTRRTVRQGTRKCPDVGGGKREYLKKRIPPSASKITKKPHPQPNQGGEAFPGDPENVEWPTSQGKVGQETVTRGGYGRNG